MATEERRGQLVVRGWVTALEKDLGHHQGQFVTVWYVLNSKKIS